MSLNPAITANNIKARLKNSGLQTRQLEATPENRKLLAEYQALVKSVNEIPARISGLRMNYRKRDIPAQVSRLLTLREEQMERIIVIEKTLFPKDA